MMQQPHAHLARPALKEPPAHAPNAALLIDFDNMTMGIRSDLHTELKRLLQSEIIRGKVAVQRAYADWRRYHQYIVPLSESSIDLIFAPAYGSNKKNATDIRLAIDALELVFTRPEIGTFILLSGDSDFSSLVLKLKEYGKYVIGVGIRESSSDLLIQNCDEYFSYNELAGFTKESEASYEPRDPWELVVEAVKQMTAHNDVMRSDRLKQVMQEIDPNFEEKNAGRFSRFSQFVTEAAKKGLLSVSRLDNGQYEVALGAAARGAPSGSPASVPAASNVPAAPAPPRESRGRERRDEGSRRSGFSLADTLGALRNALKRFGGEESVNADQLREAMAATPGVDNEALEPGRFPKLLRQAHDAEIIDLSKEEDGAYAVRLRDTAAPVPESEAPAALERAPAPSEEDVDPPMPASSAPPPPYSQPVPAPGRSARFRRGSRGGRPAAPAVPKVGMVEVDPNFRPRVDPTPVTPPVGMPSAPDAPPGDREEGGRDGRRGGRGRGGRGRGGRGRDREGGGSGGAGQETRGEGAKRGWSDDHGRPEREGEHRRRGGRGRGGRGRRREGNGGGSGGGGGREAANADAMPYTPEPQPRAETRPAEPRPEPPAPGGDPGESFWSRVKRGLIGE